MPQRGVVVTGLARHDGQVEKSHAPRHLASAGTALTASVHLPQALSAASEERTLGN